MSQKRGVDDLKEQDISPPPPKRRLRQPSASESVLATESAGSEAPRCLPSPFHLTQVRDLSDSANKDTFSLSDLLGDPLIKECWIFNYLFDVDWLMSHFDVDVRRLVSVKVVHGSWRKDDSNKLSIDEAAARWPNVEPITAYMPETYGTHHSKMMIALRHDDAAQIVIHTANMISRDWKNMTQASWMSPRLPLILDCVESGNAHSPIGSGGRFKYDLLRYLLYYGERRTGSLTDQLRSYDFTSIRAALVASVPCRLLLSRETKPETLFGWPYLRHVLRDIPDAPGIDASLIVAQVT